MTKNQKIALILSLLVVGLFSALYVFVLKMSTFKITADVDDFEVILTDIKNPKNQYKLQPNSTHRVKKAIYNFKIVPEKYTNNHQELDLNNNFELHLEPDFSNQYAQQIFQQDIKQVSDLLIQKYNFITLKQPQIIFKNRGEYLIATISELPNSVRVYDAVDVFKVIFRKNQTTWQQLTEPQLIFYQNDFPDIPKTVLDTANSILYDL